MTESPPTSARASRRAGPRRPTAGRLCLLAAAEQIFATRGLGVPNREIVAAAGQHNRSAITYHFASRAGLIDAVRERHETPIAQHRRHLIARLPGPGDRTTRQLVEAYVQPVMAEILRCTPSFWARLSEMLLADQPLRFSGGTEPSADLRPRQRGDTAAPELSELVVAHLSHLPALEAADRVALTIRFLNSGLARWERDNQAGGDGVEPLAPYTLLLTDLAVAMLDARSSLPPWVDAHLYLTGPMAGGWSFRMAGSPRSASARARRWPPVRPGRPVPGEVLLTELGTGQVQAMFTAIIRGHAEALTGTGPGNDGRHNLWSLLAAPELALSRIT